MMTGTEAVQFIRALVSGQPPRERDKLEYTSQGWRLRRDHWRGSREADPDDYEDGDFWYNSTDAKMRIVVSGAIIESGGWSAKP